MDKLEHYLDQVCRGIAGPRSLRQHIRQELREHLFDAVSGHENAGLTHEEAINRALEEFGGPDDVRRDLEATHGHRLMTVVVDKAMQWREKTMKAKWLWMTWAHLMLGIVIGIAALSIFMTMTFFFSKLEYMAHEGWLQADGPDAVGIEVFLFSLIHLLAECMNSWSWWVIPLAAVWVVFEWRSRAENKALIRLAGMGSVAAILAVLTVSFGVSSLATLTIELPRMHRQHPEPRIMEHFSMLSSATRDLESAAKTQNWTQVEDSLRNMSDAIGDLSYTGAAAPVLISAQDPQKLARLRALLTETRQAVYFAHREAFSRSAEQPDVTQAIEKSNAVLKMVAMPTTIPAKE